jgi:hypothetical protein
MKNQGSVSPSKSHNNTKIEYKDNKSTEMSERIQKPVVKSDQ